MDGYKVIAIEPEKGKKGHVTVEFIVDGEKYVKTFCDKSVTDADFLHEQLVQYHRAFKNGLELEKQERVVVHPDVSKMKNKLVTKLELPSEVK